jgi:hypothetical protein
MRLVSEENLFKFLVVAIQREAAAEEIVEGAQVRKRHKMLGVLCRSDDHGDDMRSAAHGSGGDGGRGGAP